MPGTSVAGSLVSGSGVLGTSVAGMAVPGASWRLKREAAETGHNVMEAEILKGLAIDIFVTGAPVTRAGVVGATVTGAVQWESW